MSEEGGRCIVSPLSMKNVTLLRFVPVSLGEMMIVAKERQTA